MSSCDFMPQVARDFVYYGLMFIKLILIQKYLHWDLSSLLLVRTNNLAIF